MHEIVRAGSLAVAYEETGRTGGWPVVLLHGFPYDVRAYDDVARQLADDGARVIVPYLRGFGPTRFVDGDTPRSGEQAALGTDLLQLLDALSLDSVGLAGYDWGGRAANVVAALWPERARYLVTCNGYQIQDIAAAARPSEPEAEHRYWYQYYFHGERGRAGLASRRRELCRFLWSLWSPGWDFDERAFQRTAASFDNDDFVDVVIHSYRHRFGLVPGDEALADVEARLAAQPPIDVPTITLDGDADGVDPPRDASAHAARFSRHVAHVRVPDAGHNLPQEAPTAFAAAILRLQRQDHGVPE